MNTSRPSAARLRVPERSQIVMAMRAADDLVDADHPVRVIWQVVATLDLGRFYESIKAREGEVGRNATDPRLLVSLWLYAATDGVGSARGLGRPCHESKAYPWPCGGGRSKHHTHS